jgi:hypothetical protein
MITFLRYIARQRLILVIGILLSSCRFAQAYEWGIDIQYLSPKAASPFQGQLLVHVSNDGFTSVSLAESIKNSELLVDGHSYPRNDQPFEGPAGLAVQDSWEGCMPLDAYVPGPLVPGTHHIQLRLGETLSKEIRIKVEKITEAATSPEDRRRQVSLLKEVIVPGMLHSCVENWLTKEDGGLLQTRNTTRYYVAPNVKVLVSYEPGQPEPRVKDRIRIYSEAPLAD